MTPTELRTRRQALGLSQHKLARALGVTAKTVAAWEQGVHPAPPYLALALEALERRSVVPTRVGVH